MKEETAKSESKRAQQSKQEERAFVALNSASLVSSVVVLLVSRFCSLRSYFKSAGLNITSFSGILDMQSVSRIPCPYVAQNRS